MTVERDNFGYFHVRGVYDDGKPSWGIQVWLKGSNQDGPEDHEYRVINGRFNGNGINRRERPYWRSFNSGKNFS
jgi:hypothetical protein